MGCCHSTYLCDCLRKVYHYNNYVATTVFTLRWYTVSDDHNCNVGPGWHSRQHHNSPADSSSQSRSSTPYYGVLLPYYGLLLPLNISRLLDHHLRLVVPEQTLEVGRSRITIFKRDLTFVVTLVWLELVKGEICFIQLVPLIKNELRAVYWHCEIDLQRPLWV